MRIEHVDIGGEYLAYLTPGWAKVTVTGVSPLARGVFVARVDEIDRETFVRCARNEGDIVDLPARSLREPWADVVARRAASEAAAQRAAHLNALCEQHGIPAAFTSAGTDLDVVVAPHIVAELIEQLHTPTVPSALHAMVS